MSEKTAPALAKLDTLLPLIKSMAAGADRDKLIEEGEALQRAVAAFHMEAIRFRMHNVERLLKQFRVFYAKDRPIGVAYGAGICTP